MKVGVVTMPLAFLGTLAFLFVVGTSGAGPDGDSDGDGIQDNIDNCVDVKNPTQFDVDRDGYGNICDPDINNDNVVGIPDLGALRASFGSAAGSPTFNAAADINEDEVIGIPDLGALRAAFGGGPGPSGRGCAGAGGIGSSGENCPDDDTTAVLSTP